LPAGGHQDRIGLRSARGLQRGGAGVDAAPAVDGAPHGRHRRLRSAPEHHGRGPLSAGPGAPVLQDAAARRDRRRGRGGAAGGLLAGRAGQGDRRLSRWTGGRREVRRDAALRDHPRLRGLGAAPVRSVSAGRPARHRRALKRMTASAIAHVASAGQLVAAKKFADAEVALQRALETAPGDVKALTLLALVRYKLGRLDQARATYRELVRAAPNDADARRNLGLLALKLGHLEEAQPELEMAVRL